MADKVISVMLRAIVGPFQAQMAKAATTTQAFGSAAAASGRQVGKMGSSTGMLTAGLLGTAGLLAGIKSVTGAAIRWESAFAGVTKTVEGTPEQLDRINVGLREMSKTIPTSAEDLAGIAESAGQLGIETDNVLEFTRVIADLGETTNLAGEQGATQLARFANITGMAQENFDRLGSVIVDLGNNMATTEAEISEFALRIAGAGVQVGLSEGQILAFGAALSSVGIRAEAGGTAISKVMIDIADEVENSGDRLELFADVAGMTATQFSDAWQQDAAGALTAFISGLGNLEGTGRSALTVLSELGITETRMRDALLRSSAASDVLTDALGIQGEAWTNNSALADEAAKRYDTTAAKLEIAANNIEEAKRRMGTPLMITVGFVAQGFNAGMETPNMFEDQPGVLDNLIAAIQRKPKAGRDTDGFWDFVKNLYVGSNAPGPALQNFTEDWRVYADAIDGAGELTGFFADQLEEVDRDLDGLSSAIDGFVDPLGTYTDMVRESAEATAESTADSKDSWEDYADDATVSLDEFTEALRTQLEDLAQWEENLGIIAERGSAEFALQLAELGPEAAGLVAQIATATDAELAEIEALFAEKARTTGEAYVNGLADRLELADDEAKDAAEFLLMALDVSSEAYGIGLNVAQSFIDAIRSKYDDVVVSTSELGRRAASGLRNELIIQSPSKVFEGFGVNTVAGFTRGVEGAMSDVDRTFARLAASATGPMASSTVSNDNRQFIANLNGGDATDATVELRRLAETIN